VLERVPSHPSHIDAPPFPQEEYDQHLKEKGKTGEKVESA
jgi:hypothetical protein